MCSKCVQLGTEVQKLQITVSHLQKKCKEKTSEIKRLRLSEKRSKAAKTSLEGILKEVKDRKWISDEGSNVLNVNRH